MAIIQIKRGRQEAVEALSLAQGELAVALDSGNVYVGTESGKVWLNQPTGTVDKAKQLATAQNFSISGDATSPAVSFNGTQSVNLALTLNAISGLTAGTYTKLTVNEKGLVTAGGTIQISDITGLGTAATANTGSQPGNVVVVQTGGTILESLLPDLSGTYVSVGTTVNGKPLSGNVTLTAADVGAVASSQIGAAGGVASLDESGKIPSTQLPSYVDDVVEVDTYDALPDPGQADIIYVTKDTNLTYRWGGSAYVVLNPSLALGTTAETAFAGNLGQTAYEHSQITNGNPHGTTYSMVGAAPESHVSVVASATVLGHVKPNATDFTVAADGAMTIKTVDGGTF